MTDRPEGDAGRCMRPARMARWTRPRRKMFLATLAETSNVTAAARAAGMNRAGAYDLKARDESFARQWKAALEQGYAELEMHLMRHTIEGTTRTEKVVDGETGQVKQVRVVHSFPLTMAARLLAAHRAEVAAWRRDGGDAWGDESKETEIDRLNAHMDRVRARLLDGMCHIGKEAGQGKHADG